MRTVVPIVLMCALTWTAATAQNRAAQEGGKQAFTAVAMSPGGPRSNPVSGTLDIVIDRRSTTAERQRLMEAFAKGQDAALEVLQDLPRIGHISSGGSLGWDLHYADETAGEDGGRRLFLATDRPISQWEAYYRPRVSDYPFTFIELRLNKDGIGEGKLSAATKVIANKEGRFLELEDWDVPVALTKVTPRR